MAAVVELGKGDFVNRMGQTWIHSELRAAHAAGSHCDDVYSAEKRRLASPSPAAAASSLDMRGTAAD